jgi:hypothetical protein
MYGRIIYADQQVRIGGYLLSGVTSFKGDYQIPWENIDTIGYLDTNQNITKELTRNISLSRHIVGQDPLYHFTGDLVVGGTVIYKNTTNQNYKNFGFTSGYMTSYKISARVGELVKADTDFVVYKDIGGGISGSEPFFNTQVPFVPATASDLYLSASEGQQNRITSFEYSIQCRRMPQYVLGSFNPAYVVLKKPLPVTVNMTIEIDEYMSPSMQSLICNPYIQNLTLNLNACNNPSNHIMEYTINNARLINNSFEGSLSENTSVKLVYQGYIV